MAAYRLIRVGGGAFARQFEAPDDGTAARVARLHAREYLEVGFGSGPPVGFELQRGDGERWQPWQVFVSR